MTKGQRIGLGIGITVVVLLVLYTNRSMWQALISAKWSKRFPFVKEYDAAFWKTLSTAELRRTWAFGLPTWFEEEQARAQSGQLSGA